MQDTDSTSVPGLAVARLQELFDRDVARAKAALHGDGGVKRQQRDGEIAIGSGRKEIAADGAHVAHGGTADRAGRGMQEGEVPFGEDAREGDPGPERHARTGCVDPGQRLVVGANDGRDRHIALVQRAHHQCAAAEIARAAVRGQRPGRLAGAGERLHCHGHDDAASFRCRRIASNPA
ncbi:hypothetical protein ABIF50_004707 [Bradyrhizobium diazoefficiens]